MQQVREADKKGLKTVQQRHRHRTMILTSWLVVDGVRKMKK
jgi:hypothetical protein